MFYDDAKLIIKYDKRYKLLLLLHHSMMESFDNILSDLLVQDLDDTKYEILVLEAGVYENFKTKSKVFSKNNVKFHFLKKIISN